jgi:hypothetical protein
VAEPVRSGKRVAAAALGAAVIATVILLTLVLPAEYAIDPLGTGDALGLLGLSKQPPEAITSAPTAFAVDVISFDLAPFESVEYKYRLESGASLLFSWEASAETVYDLHAEPDDAQPGYAESFARGKAASGHGTYLARFSGIHGWFFENRQPVALTLTLTTAGFYAEATEFRDGWETLHQPQSVTQVLRP